jgi:hypothetical protein
VTGQKSQFCFYFDLRVSSGDVITPHVRIQRFYSSWVVIESKFYYDPKIWDAVFRNVLDGAFLLAARIDPPQNLPSWDGCGLSARGGSFADGILKGDVSRVSDRLLVIPVESVG